MSAAGEAGARPAAARDEGAARRELLARLVGGAAIGGAVKIAGVGLAFLFFLVLARVTDPVEYGVFASAFSLATILGFAATIGQHTAILRFWPALDERHGPGAAAQATRRGLILTALGGAAVLAAFVALAASPVRIGGFGEDGAIYAWIGAMALAFALSEFAVAALRARGLLLRALGPREIMWRVAVIALALALPAPLDGTTALALAALVLIAVTLPQLAALLRELATHRATALAPEDRAAMRHATWGLWGLAGVNQLAAHGPTVVVALVLGPAQAGAFFAADRLAKLLSVALIGVNQIAGPMLARAYHGGRIEEVRLLAAASSALALTVSAAGFLLFVLLGQFALGLFDQSYTDAYWVLLILSSGQLINSAAGVNGVLLMLAGRERIMLRIMVFFSAFGLVATYLSASVLGLTGAATATAGTMILWHLAAKVACKAQLGVDPFFRRLFRPSDTGTRSSIRAAHTR